MTYNDLRKFVTQYSTTFQRFFWAFATVNCQILAWFWSNPYAKPVTNNEPKYY
jgi:hypothetical protein